MVIKATEKEVIRAACRAIAASTPIGLGYLHYNESDDKPTPADVKKYLLPSGMFIDYYRGRMVKFNMVRIGGDLWDCITKIDPEYQSWAREYEGYADLFLTERK